MILLGCRSSEGGHNGIAGELLERAAGPFDLRGDSVEVPFEQSPGALRILLAELRRADEIDEEDGRQLALRRRLRGHRRRRLRSGNRFGRMAACVLFDLERRVVAQDRLLEIVQPATRFEPELLDERPAGLLIGGERLRLTAGTVKRHHQLGP